MTKNQYESGTHNYHNTFGGIIYSSDFNTDYRGKDNKHGSAIADRIIRDRKFDRSCMLNATLRNK